MDTISKLNTSAWLLTVSLMVLSSHSASASVYQGCGVKVGEVDQGSAIVWTRLTQSKDQTTKGYVINKADPFDKKNNSYEMYPTGVDDDKMLGAVPGSPGEVRLSYHESDRQGKSVQTKWVSVDQSSDFTHKFKISGLKPATKYDYEIDSRSDSGSQGQTVKGSFKTSPTIDQAAPVMFTVVTGQKFRNRDRANGHQIFTVMAAMKPDFFVHTGDYVYMVDKWINSGPPADAMGHARLQWQRIHSFELQKEFYRFVPVFMMKDDHDIGVNDCDPTKGLDGYSYWQGIDMFNEQMPTGDTPYRTRRWGKDLQIWMVEGRDFRSPNAMPDGPDKTIWGKEQFDWLQKSVKASDAAFKVLISPTPIVGPDRSNKKDNHANSVFKHEGDKIRQWIHDEAPELFLVCGDRHWQYVSIHPETGVREYCSGSTSDSHAGGWSSGFEKEYHRYLNVIGGFLSVTVERVNGTPNIVFRHHDVEGKVRNEDRHVR